MLSALTALLAPLLPVITPVAAHAASSPAYAFADVGSVDTVGSPEGVSNDGTVATRNGVWRKGVFTPVPGAGSFVLGISADGLVLGTSLTACAEVCAIAWDPRTNAITSYPRPAETLDPQGHPCGGGRLYGLDPAHEAYGFIQYFSSTTADHCVGGATTQVGYEVATPGSATPTHIAQLDNVLDLIQHYALGFPGAGGTSATLVRRSDSSVTTHVDLALDEGHHGALTDDGAIAALQEPSGLPSYTSPAGVTTVLQHPDAGSEVVGMNASHAMVGMSSAGGILWASPTAAPVAVETLTTIPAAYQADSSTTADYISDTGNIVGTFSHQADSADHVYALTIGNDLSAAISVTAANGTAYTQGSGLAGDHLTAHVALHNASASLTLTGLTLDTALQSANGGLILGSPSSLQTTSLAPGADTSYDVPMTVTGAGRTTLHMAAHATGNAREDATADQLLILGSPLVVSYRFQTGGVDLGGANPANTFVLPDSDDGELPADVTVTEKLLNRSGGPVDTVTALPLTLLTVDPNAKHLPFPVTVTDGPVYAPDFSHTLADGASTTVTWTLHVVKNIDLRVRDLVLSHTDDGVPNDTSIGEDVLHVRPAHELLLKVVNDDGTTQIKTGHPFTLTGTVTNLDQSRPLELDPLIPDFDGNAGGQAVLSDGTPTLDGFVPPVAGRLDPGEEKTFTVTIQTIKEAGTRGTVTWTPAGKVVNADGTETALAGRDIRIADGTTPMQLHLDDSDPAPIATTAGERAWVFSAAALETMRDWCANGFNAVTDWRGNLTAIGGGLVATGGIIVKNAQALKVGLDFTHAVTALVFYWDGLTEAERQSFSQEVAIDLGATNEAWREFANPIQSAVFSYFQKSQTALARGDLLEVAQLRGERLGAALPEGLSLFLPELVLNKVARGLSWGTRVAGGIADTTVARTISLSEKIKDFGLVLKAAKGIEGVKVGGDLLANGYKVLIKEFGMSARDVDALRFWAKKNNLLIAVRQRSELTLHWLHEFKAVLKPELVKIKNVDAIDAKFLGYLSVDEGSVVFRKPLDRKLVQARIRSAPPELRQAIAKRYGQRVKEWKKYERQYKSWDGTLQELGFDKKAQGIVEPTRGKPRRFELGKSVDVHGGDEYYRVKIGDEHGVPRRVTGDIDVVAITNIDGTIPSAAVRSQMYEDLQAAIGMQHGETLSWIVKGELLSSTKAGLLADHLPGRELLAVFGPEGGCRAAYFDPGLTIFNEQTGVAAATFIGAYTTPLERASRYVGVNLARFF